MGDVWTWVWVVIPMTAILSGTANRWLRYKREQLTVQSQATAEQAAQYAVRTERLEQRVAVLERILTDPAHHLAGEIERLRDAPLN